MTRLQDKDGQTVAAVIARAKYVLVEPRGIELKGIKTEGRRRDRVKHVGDLPGLLFALDLTPTAKLDFATP